jgi:hypothetical protein
MRLWKNNITSTPIIPFFIVNLYYRMRDRRLRADGIVYSLIITFLALFTYAILYPFLKAIIMASMPGIGEVEALVILVIPVAIFIGILWGVTWLIQPRKA